MRRGGGAGPAEPVLGSGDRRALPGPLGPCDEGRTQEQAKVTGPFPVRGDKEPPCLPREVPLPPELFSRAGSLPAGAQAAARVPAVALRTLPL